jgi:hypothetical protein
VTIAMEQGWLDVIEGPWLLNAAVLSLAVLAIASVVTGLAALIGRAGIGVAAVLMVFVGSPSGTSSCRSRRTLNRLRAHARHRRLARDRDGATAGLPPARPLAGRPSYRASRYRRRSG